MGLTDPLIFFNKEKSISNYDSIEITESESNKKEIRNNEKKNEIRNNEIKQAIEPIVFTAVCSYYR